MHQSPSPNTINRLPKYLRYLSGIYANGEDRISSFKMAEDMDLTASQIRQDLSQFGSYGAQGYGYQVPRLIHELKKILGIDNPHNVIAVGVGSIGRALLTHLNFTEHNYSVCAGFDIDPEIVGTTINGIPIYHADKLKEFLKMTPVDICILAVPASIAKETAGSIVEQGIPAIWNMTNVDLGLSHMKAIVEDLHFLDSLFALTYYLNENA